MTDSHIKIAVAQIDASTKAGHDRMQWLETKLQLASNQAVELLVLPELFVSGYNVGSLVDQLAETSDGPTAKAIAALAKKYQIAIHYGFAERDGTDEARLYNAAQCIGPEGKVLGHYRKRLLPPGFEASYFTKGNEVGLFKWCGFTLVCLFVMTQNFQNWRGNLPLPVQISYLYLRLWAVVGVG